MKITIALILLITANFIRGLPVDRELLRVKRKGEGEIDNNEETFHRVRRSQDDLESEIRRKRRFFAPNTPAQETEDSYKTKMEARSSRSSREDRDITAKRPERFRLRIRKRSQDGSSILRGDTPGSGSLPGSGSSGAGLWMGPLLEKKNDKRSAGSNSLDNLIATLRAISSLSPDEDDNSAEEVRSSGSGLWIAPESTVDNKLPQFFQEEANSGSGENPEKALRLLSETAQRELNQKANEVGSGAEQRVQNDDKKETEQQTGERLFRREIESDAPADDLIAASENQDKRGDSEQEDNPASSSGSADDWQEIEDKISEQPDEKVTRSLTEALLPDAYYRTKRSSQENAFLVSDHSLGENDALIGDSLVARFYRDQDAVSDDVTETSMTSLPSETQSLSSPETQEKPVKRELENHNFRDFSEPRVVYTRQIREAREPIIERPAVYSQIEDESEMDSSFGGEDDDDDEPTLTIHEREIREDGYVGCYEDKAPDRDLPSIVSVPKLTPDSCRSACRTAGHAYAGVQYGYLCRCGDSYGKYTKVSDEECNTHCTGDHAQKCGGFWRSAIFTTAGAMEPSKRGNFFHIESVRPMTDEDLFDIPRSDIASGGEAEAEEHQQPIITETFHLTASESPATEVTAAEVVTTPLESSGNYVQEIHREPSLQESPVQSLPIETAQEENSLNTHSSGEEHPHEKADSTHATVSASTVEPDSAHAVDISPAIAISEAPPQALTQSEPKPSAGSPAIATQPVPSVVHPQHNETPQGTHGSRLIYLHQQQDILSKPTPKTIVAVAPGKLKEGTVVYTGTIKLKQSWLDQFEDANSAESKILTGNIEQAFKRVFKNDPKFVKAEVVGFREGLVKHNPNTIRKVIAPFILKFKNGIQGIEEKLKNMVQNVGKLDDMPVYKHSLQLSEYSHSPAVGKAPETMDEASKVDLVEEDKKRSTVNIPNGGVDPFLKGIFRQISA